MDNEVNNTEIRKLLQDKESVLVFDVDGVLAVMEWGKYNHYAVNDEEWTKQCKEGNNFYTKDRVSLKMQEFLKNKNMRRIYVITTVGDNNEGEFKREFVNTYYNILKENVYYVNDNKEKRLELLKIKEKYPKLANHNLIMIDDTVEILNDIMDNTNFSTAHISTFLDLEVMLGTRDENGKVIFRGLRGIDK